MNVIPLFQLDTVSLKTVVVNKNVEEATNIKINLPLKKTRKWTMIKDAMGNYSLAEFKNSIQYHSLFYRAEKKFCDEDTSVRRAVLLNNNHSRTYEVKDELDIFSVNTINPSDPQTLQNVIKECVKYQNEHWIQENAMHPWKAKKPFAESFDVQELDSNRFGVDNASRLRMYACNASEGENMNKIIVL